MPSRILFALSLALGLSLSILLGSTQAKDEFLNAFGLEPSKESLGLYLQSLLPDSPELASIDHDFASLGADNYAERFAAFTTLRDRPFVPRANILQATRHADPEVRRWSERLRAETGNRNRQVLLRVLATISDRTEPVRGLTDELLDLNAHLPSPSFIYQAREALLSTAQTNDLERILADFEQRPAIHHLRLLDQLLGNQCVPYLEPVLAADTDTSGQPSGDNPASKNEAPFELAIEAARLLLIHGERKPLAGLANMVDDQGNLHRGAASLLGQATGKYFADPPGWQTWIEQHGATAQLKVLSNRSQIIHHRLLVAIWDSGEVLEFDAQGKQRWTFEIPNAMSVQGLPNGHRLLIGHNDREVREFDAEGEQVWSINLPDDPVFVQRLPNGNTHVACERLMLLYDSDGEKISETKLEHRAWFCARRLTNGNTLVTYIKPTVLVELDPDGKEIWRLDTKKRLRDASRLANGNTIVVELGGKVQEYSPDKKLLWESPAGLQPVCAVRLPSGNTRVITGSGMIELTPTGQRIDILKLKLHKTPNGGSYF